MTDIRLAIGGSRATMRLTLPKDHPNPPSALLSYHYYKAFAPMGEYGVRDWVMDSGAYSAHNVGVTIDIDAYIDHCKHLLATDPKLIEVFALDVIGDWRASLKNTEYMWKRGVPAIPTYHMGEPWDVLTGLARDYPKIGLGGSVHQKSLLMKRRWFDQCFARTWPVRVHGLGMLAVEILNVIPFHSVDATNWQLRPTAFGWWASFGKMSVRGGPVDLRREVDYYMAIETRLKTYWKREMAELAALPPLPRSV